LGREEKDSQRARSELLAALARLEERQWTKKESAHVMLTLRDRYSLLDSSTKMRIQALVALELAVAFAKEDMGDSVTFELANDADTRYPTDAPCCAVDSRDGDAMWGTLMLPNPEQIQLWVFRKDGETIFVNARTAKVCSKWCDPCFLTQPMLCGRGS
jgi:hypothetical protein